MTAIVGWVAFSLIVLGGFNWAYERLFGGE